MKTRVAINGFGRIGRNAFKVAFDRSDIEIVVINDRAGAEILAHLLKHDTTYGTYHYDVKSDESHIIVNGAPVKVINEANPALYPWGDMAIDVVIESSGEFMDQSRAQLHVAAGAKRVVVSAPIGGSTAPAVVIGANEDTLAGAGDVISVGSCAANCVSPVLRVLERAYGIEKVMTTTIHSYVADQKLQDGIAQDLRVARNGAQNIVPVAGVPAPAPQAFTQLADTSGGLTLHVPVAAVALNDFVVLVKKSTTAEDVNALFRTAAADPFYQGILDVTDEPLVSSDFIGSSFSAIVDLGLTRVVGGNMVKIIAWYDNEWGYSNRLIELVADTGSVLHKKEDHSQAHN